MNLETIIFIYIENTYLDQIMNLIIPLFPSTQCNYEKSEILKYMGLGFWYSLAYIWVQYSMYVLMTLWKSVYIILMQYRKAITSVTSIHWKKSLLEENTFILIEFINDCYIFLYTGRERHCAIWMELCITLDETY